jgi:serine/threonine protein kinase
MYMYLTFVKNLSKLDNNITNYHLVNCSWIAPEMLLPATRISCAVDIFSYGCIMYYVLSEGQHPFGNDVYRRQNNILNYDYDLSSLAESTQGSYIWPGGSFSALPELGY